MATHDSFTKNQKTNIMVITGTDETLQNLLSIIQKSENSGEFADITRHVVSVLNHICVTFIKKSYFSDQ